MSEEYGIPPDDWAFTVWLTGPPCSGKTTLAYGLRSLLWLRGIKAEVLDGELIRAKLGQGLGFSKQDRDTNVRRIAFVCKLLSRNSIATIVGAISPYEDTRRQIRMGLPNFVEVYCKCPLPVLIERDYKGLYAKALDGEIEDFTLISAPYEESENPEVVVETDKETPSESIERIVAKLEELGHLSNWG